MIRLPYGDAYSQKKIDDFCDEAVGYPRASHDDSLCGFVHCLHALKKVGNTYSVAIGDKVFNHLGENIANEKHVNAVQSVLSERGIITQHEEVDLDDPMAERWTGIMGD